MANNKEHDLIQAAKEMLAHSKGEIALPTRKFSPPEMIDVTGIRKELGYTQSEFANHFGFKLSTLRDWEQGRRKPESTARTLLAIIAKHPEIVEQTLSDYTQH